MATSWVRRKSAIGFKLHGRADTARAGVLHTAHGDVATPALCVISPRGLTADELRAAGVQLVGASNLDLRPDALGRLGRIHQQLGWNGPVLMDAGSEQIFALADSPSGHGRLVRVDRGGVTFASPFDGSLRTITPESALSDMAALAPDVLVPLFPAPFRLGPRKPGGDPVALAENWARRAVAAREGDHLLLLGIPAAADLEALVPSLAQLAPDGYALSVGRDGDTSEPLTALPSPGIRLLAEATTPQSVEIAVRAGVDLIGWRPNPEAVQGDALTSEGLLDLVDITNSTSFLPLDPDCRCPACSVTRAYLHHLFATHELLGPRLVALHNLTFMSRFVRGLRMQILAHTFPW